MSLKIFEEKNVIKNSRRDDDLLLKRKRHVIREKNHALPPEYLLLIRHIIGLEYRMSTRPFEFCPMSDLTYAVLPMRSDDREIGTPRVVEVRSGRVGRRNTLTVV